MSYQDPTIDWRRLPPLSALRAFEAAARLQGFSAAARALNVTPAAVAQQVRNLEAELGVRLVRRVGRGIALTPAGQNFATRLGDGFAAIAAGVRDLVESEHSRGLRVLTTTFIVDALIMPRMNEFWQKHPGTEVSFTPGPCHSDITPSLFEENGYDVIVMTGSGDWPGVTAELMLECPILAVGTPELCRRAREDLNAVPWIWDRDDTVVIETLRAIGVDTNRAARVDVGNPRLERAAAHAGHGMSLSSQVVALPDIRAGLLEVLPVPNPPRGRYNIATLPGHRRPAVADFVAWLHQLGTDWQREVAACPDDPKALAVT